MNTFKELLYRTKLEQIITERIAMTTLNQWREARGEAQAYGHGEFTYLLQKLVELEGEYNIIGPWIEESATNSEIARKFLIFEELNNLRDENKKLKKMVEERKVTKPKSKMSTEDTENIICPYCGKENYDSYENLILCFKDIECEECGKIFWMIRHVLITYSTQKITTWGEKI